MRLPDPVRVWKPTRGRAGLYQPIIGRSKPCLAPTVYIPAIKYLCDCCHTLHLTGKKRRYIPYRGGLTAPSRKAHSVLPRGPSTGGCCRLPDRQPPRLPGGDIQPAITDRWPRPDSEGLGTVGSATALPPTKRGWSALWNTTSRRRAELPPDWPAIRSRVLRDANYRCSKHGCPNRATDVDHTGDRDDHSRLAALCSDHHKWKTSRQGVAQRRKLQAQRKRPPERHPGTR